MAYEMQCHVKAYLSDRGLNNKQNGLDKDRLNDMALHSNNSSVSGQ